MEFSFNPFENKPLSFFTSQETEQASFWPYSNLFIKYGAQELKGINYITNDEGRSISNFEFKRDIDEVSELEGLNDLKVKLMVTAEDYVVVLTHQNELY